MNRIGRFISEKRPLCMKVLPVASFLLLGAYFVIMFPVYPGWRDLWPSLAGTAVVCGILSMLCLPPAERPTWPYWLFVSGTVGFILSNLLAVHFAVKIPDLGKTSIIAMHIPGVLVALAAGVGLRESRHLAGFLALILIVSGIWYLNQALSLTWSSPYREAKLVLSREYHVVLAMELVLAFSLFMGYAALAEKPRYALASLMGAILVGILLFMTKTRSALIVMAFVTLPAVAMVQTRWGTFRQRTIAFLILLLVLAPMGCLVWFAKASPERRSLSSVLGRVQAWAVAVQVAGERPWPQNLLGNGRFLSTFSSTAKYYGVNEHSYGGEELLHAHNVLLQTFLETGILGTSALIMIWIAAAYRSLLAWTRHGKTVAGVMLIALLTMSFLGQMDYCLNGLWGVEAQFCWFIVGLAFASGSSCAPSWDPQDAGGS